MPLSDKEKRALWEGSIRTILEAYDFKKHKIRNPLGWLLSMLMWHVPNIAENDPLKDQKQRHGAIEILEEFRRQDIIDELKGRKLV